MYNFYVRKNLPSKKDNQIYFTDFVYVFLQVWASQEITHTLYSLL